MIFEFKEKTVTAQILYIKDILETFFEDTF